jgi:hypothetical protein
MLNLPIHMGVGHGVRLGARWVLMQVPGAVIPDRVAMKGAAEGASWVCRAAVTCEVIVCRLGATAGTPWERCH